MNIKILILICFVICAIGCTEEYKWDPVEIYFYNMDHDQMYIRSNKIKDGILYQQFMISNCYGSHDFEYVTNFTNTDYIPKKDISVLKFSPDLSQDTVIYPGFNRDQCCFFAEIAMPNIPLTTRYLSEKTYSINDKELKIKLVEFNENYEDTLRDYKFGVTRAYLLEDYGFIAFGIPEELHYIVYKVENSKIPISDLRDLVRNIDRDFCNGESSCVQEEIAGY